MIPRIEFDPGAAAPLDGVRVIDLSRLVAGNMLSLQLADQGAEVIKVEDPKHGDPLRAWRVNGLSLYWKVYGRNKKSLALNLRTEQGRAVLHDLAAGSDVLVENFRPGTLESMGFAPEVLHAANPKLVIVRVSGFGQDGPYRERPGFGTLVEAMSGFAAKTGFADRTPVLPPLALADMIAGLYGAYATMVALRVVERGGEGQVIDLPLLDPIMSILGPDAAIFRVSGEKPQRTGSRSATTSPRNVWETADGRFVAISASMQTMAERLFRAIGRPDMIEDPRFRTNTDRVRNADACEAPVAAFIKARTLAENSARVRGGGSDGGAGLRDRPVHRRPARAGAGHRGGGAGRGGGVGADAQCHPPPVRHARTPAPRGAAHRAGYAGGVGGDRLRRGADRRAGGRRGGAGRLRGRRLVCLG